MGGERLFIDGGGLAGGRVCGGAGKAFKVGERDDGGACGGLADANVFGLRLSAQVLFLRI